jgi:hypothetical protein
MELFDILKQDKKKKELREKEREAMKPDLLLEVYTGKSSEVEGLFHGRKATKLHEFSQSKPVQCGVQRSTNFMD